MSGKETVARLDPDVEVGKAITARRGAEQRRRPRIGDSKKVIVDCMDNIPTRFVLNGCAMRKDIPLVHGTVWGLEGRLAVFRPPHTACLNCFIAEAPPKEIFPVVGATPGVIGCMQVVETLKLLTGQGTTLDGKLLLWDGTTMQFRTLNVVRDPECPTCGR
ncbi:MAG: ThiF family adenylyltransferase [Deltaproteobacteria bacterium]|nr:ThiF family adenylyltransferase [Deltaproteobacteria bacterium]